MATYTWHQKGLLSVAQKYTELGYKVGLASGKELVEPYEAPIMVAAGWFGAMIPQPKEYSTKWDSLSIVLDGLVCVDLDVPYFDVLQWNPLPPTLKEKSPRGWHLYYRLPEHIVMWDPKINWKPHVDILTKGTGTKVSKYGKRNKPFGGHVVCTPTPGYSRVYPDEQPRLDWIPMAPTWLLDVLDP
jgi:hypothetical protein